MGSAVAVVVPQSFHRKVQGILVVAMRREAERTKRYRFIFDLKSSFFVRKTNLCPLSRDLADTEEMFLRIFGVQAQPRHPMSAARTLAQDTRPEKS